MNNTASTFFKLLRIALGNESDCSLPSGVDWNELVGVAYQQGVAAIVADGLQVIYDSNPGIELELDSREKEELKYELFAEQFVSEEDDQKMAKVLSKLAGFYKENGIEMVLLKGYGLSKYWPVPSHRPIGDIDIYLGDKWREADALIGSELGRKVDNSHHHHSVFSFGGLSVENHYDLINVYAHRSSARIEKKLKELVSKDLTPLDVCGQTVLLPGPDFNALFLAKHCASHFASTEMNLRQLLDWLLFVRAEGGKVDWTETYRIYRKENLVRFVNSMNAIGVSYLGFPREMFAEIEEDGALVERVLNDILTPEFGEKEDGSLKSALWIKPRRWWHNRWKHRICYPDTLVSSFCWSLWAKVLKPGHFRQ